MNRVYLMLNLFFDRPGVELLGQLVLAENSRAPMPIKANIEANKHSCIAFLASFC